MAGVNRGRIGWSLDIDDEGHRTYKLLTLVEMLGTSDDITTALTADGPERAVNTTPGIASIGSFWAQGNDVDQWATAWPTMKVRPYKPKGNEPNNWFTIEQTFSTRSFRTCQSTAITNPLLEPQKVSGTFVKYTREARFDINGNPIVSSSHEAYTGPDVEIDSNRPSIRIEQNSSSLRLATIASMVDTVNFFPMWGLAARTVKLSNVSWERKVVGTCGFFYTRVFDFDIKFNTFDIDLRDEGFHELNTEISEASAANAAHMRVSQDSWDQGFRRAVPLNGFANRVTTEAAAINIFQLYPTSNFNLLGIPRYF